MENIRLKIVLPHKMLPVEEAERIIIPAVKGNLTVLIGRAPTTLLLTNGVLDVLNEDNETVEKYFIQGGVANVAADECEIVTQKAINAKDITKEEAQSLKYARYKELQAMKQVFPNQSPEEMDSDSEFYEFFYQYILKEENED